ncbi:MAG TPA: iron ABC transporter permease [Xanthobacteraceae bacterium]|nr:iron ABC transporter permease [Xanthobacteraceae bacterium]
MSAIEKISPPLAAALPQRGRRWAGKLERLDAASLVMAVAVAALFFLVLYPLFWLFYGSFTYGDQLAPAAALQALATLPGLSRALDNTLLLLLGAVPLSFLFALPLVYIVSRTDTPLKGLIEIAAILPFITPPLIGAVAWALLAAPRTGLINLVARELGARGPILNIYSMGGLIFVMSLYVSPYVFITVQAAMQRMDASLEEASLISGASVARTVRNVVLPLCLPAILSAAILVITRVLEEFAIPGVLGAPSGIYTITTYIYYQAISYVPPRYEVAALLASMFMAATAILLAVQARVLSGGRSFTTVSGKGRAPRFTRLGPWRYATLAYALIYLGLTVVLPYLVLLYAAFAASWDAAPSLSNLTFANFAATFSPELSVGTGLINSVVLALSGASLAILLTLIISYMINKGKPWLRAVLDFVSSIPLAMPGPVLAVAMLWAYLHEPFVLYGTLWILLVAYMTHYLPYGVRAIAGSFRQLSTELERAAASCGASRIASFRDILLPLLRPGILAGWMLMFVSMIRELSSSIFLFVPGTETTSVAMLEMWQESRFAGVAVLSLTLIAISLCVVIFVRWLAGAAYLSGPR